MAYGFNDDKTKVEVYPASELYNKSEVDTEISDINDRIDNILTSPAPTEQEIIDARLGADGVNYPTLGGAIRGQVSDLKSDLSLIDIMHPVYTVTSGKAMTTQTTSLVDSAMFSIVNPIYLHEGETIAVTVSTFATTFGIIATCDENNTSRSIKVASDGNDNTRYSYTATEDSYVCLTIRDSDTNPHIIIYKDINDRFDTINDNVSYLQTSVEYDESFIKQMLLFSDINLTIHRGSFYTNNVVYTEYANTNFQTAELTNIEPLKYYRIHASSAYGNTIYAFLDSNDNIIEKVLDTSGSGVGTEINVTVKAPANASILKVGTFKGDGTLSVSIASGVSSVKPYVGVKWAVFGDSLTEVNATAVKKYHDWLSEELGFSIINYGASGTGYMRTYDESKAFYQRMANIDASAFDFMTIFGSGNDIAMLINNEIELGTCNDYSAIGSTPTTLGGAINQTLERYYNIAPTKPIGLVTPTPWNAYCTGWRMNRDNAVIMQNYCNLIKEIAYIRGIPCLNLFNESGFRPWDADFRTAYYNENGVQDGGTHPNSAGHKLLSHQFRQFIEKLI